MMSLISVTPKFDAFVKFCSEQDPTTAIRHNIYDTCAIGDFTPTFNELFPDDRDSPCNVMYQMVDELRTISDGMSDTFRIEIGNASNHGPLRNYGGMFKWLSQMQHQVHEAAQ